MSRCGCEFKKTETKMNNQLSQCCRFVLGAVFAFSAFAHLKNPFLFLDTVLAYQIVSGYFAVAVASILPIVELGVSVFFFATASRAIPFWASYALFGVFLVAQSFVVANGIEIDCGCFGGVIRRNVGIGSILFVGVLIGTSLLGHIAQDSKKIGRLAT